MSAFDEITLTGVRAKGYHGVYEHERRAGQDFVVDATLFLDTARAAETDEVTDTVHYGQVAERIVAVIEGQPVHLLERLAQLVADTLLAEHGVRRVRVTVHKPKAPITVPFTDVSVTIERSAA
jgi:dihydroneopterin aldolase